MVVVTRDGRFFTGKNAQAVVRAMKRTQWNAPFKKGEYMDQVATRVRQMTGDLVDVSTPDAFIASLVKIGLLSFPA